MSTMELAPASCSSAWCFESSLAAMPASRLAARMVEIANLQGSGSFPISAHVTPDAAQIPLGRAAYYFIALDMLEIALEYANVTRCLRIHCSLAPKACTVDTFAADRELIVRMLWGCCSSDGSCYAQTLHGDFEESAGTVPFPWHSETESMHHCDARMSTILAGNEEVGLKMAWPVSEDAFSNPHWPETPETRPTSLIVDHNPAQLEYLRMLLEDGGFSAELAQSPDAAIELVRSRAEAIHLAVINASPTCAAAVEVVSALRNESPTTRVLLTSDRRLVGIAGGLHSYPVLREPISPLQLLAAASDAVLTRRIVTERPSVLIADDEPSIRRLIRTALAAKGYDIVEASNGDEAVIALQCHDIDVVLLDLVMPKKEGLETIRSIKNKTTPVGVVAMSGATIDCLKVARHLGADVTLRKPLVIQELINGVKLALAVRAERIARSALVSTSARN